jgi:hypothetical protein
VVESRVTAAETKLRSEGAEFLVVGNLLIRGVHATKAYRNYPGWDVLVADPDSGRSCRVQVKARRDTNAPGFPVKNFDADFVVFVVLNRGYQGGTRRNGDTGEREPDFHVFPMAAVEAVCDGSSMWGESHRVPLAKIADHDQYREAWHLIVGAVQ